jgi:hypothetical protein
MMAAFRSFCRGDIALRTHIVIAATEDLHEDALNLAERYVPTINT